MGRVASLDVRLGLAALHPSLCRTKLSATQRMDSPPVNDNAGCLPSSGRALRQQQLLHLLLSDAAKDVEVVTRELGLRDQMRERLRRALDKMACAQSVLETIGADGAEAGLNSEMAELRMREAMGLLAREWPEEYPAGAEWLLLLSSRARERSSISNTPQSTERLCGGPQLKPTTGPICASFGVAFCEICPQKPPIFGLIVRSVYVFQSR
jgi:hypothetical protein